MVLAKTAEELSPYGEIDGFESFQDVTLTDNNVIARIYKDRNGLQEAIVPRISDDFFSRIHETMSGGSAYSLYNVKGRSSNGTYILEPENARYGQPYIITVSDSPLDALVQSIDAQLKLCEASVPVPTFMAADFFSSPMSIMNDFVDGNHFGLKKQHVATLGQALGRIHSMPARDAKPPILLHVVPTETVFSAVDAALQAAENGETACDLATMRFSAIAALLEKMPAEKMQELYPDLYQEFLSYSDEDKAILLPEKKLDGELAEGQSHNDLHALNVIRVAGEEANEQGKIVLIDFQRTGRGRFVDELALVLYFFCVNEETGRLDQELTQEFFRNYLPIRNDVNIETGNSALSKQEVAALAAKISRLARRQALPTWDMFRSRTREEYIKFSQRNDELPGQMADYLDDPEAFFNQFIYDRQNDGPSYADLVDYKPILPSIEEIERIKDYFLRAVDDTNILLKFPEWQKSRRDKSLRNYTMQMIPQKEGNNQLTVLFQPPLQIIPDRPPSPLYGQQLYSKARVSVTQNSIALTIGRLNELPDLQEKLQLRSQMEAAGVNVIKPLAEISQIPGTSYSYLLEEEPKGRGAPLRERHIIGLASEIARMHGISASVGTEENALPVSLCHNNLRREAIFCAATPLEKQQITLGGLNHLAVGECVNDIVSAIHTSCLDNEILDFEKVSAFLNRYSAEREKSAQLPLTREEFAQIPERLFNEFINQETGKNPALAKQLMPYVNHFTAFASKLRENGLLIPLQPIIGSAQNTTKETEENIIPLTPVRFIRSAQDIPDNLLPFMQTKKYQEAEAIVLDLWGVVNDDTGYYVEAIEAINKIKQDGKKIAIVSNSPFKNSTIEKRLLGFGLRLGQDYDAIITSGDITHGVFEQRNEGLLKNNRKEKYLLIGNQEHSRELIADLHQFEVTENPEEADFILCTAAPNNRENPQQDEALQALLEKCHAISQKTGKQLPIFNANPDLECPDSSGNRIYCGGMVAKMYEEMGGEVITYGKPNPNIYKKAAMAIGLYNYDKEDEGQTYPQKMIAVGDSLKTDIAGANKAGIYSVLIRSGLHYHELPGQISPLDVKYLASQCRNQDAYPDALAKSFTINPAKQRYSTVPEVIPDYDAVLLNWGGVLGDDSGFFRHAVETLKQLHYAEKQVVILSNTPYLASHVEKRLQEAGLIKGTHYSGILTAGEMAHAKFTQEQDDKKEPKKYCLISGEEDSMNLLDDLPGYQRINRNTKHISAEELAQADFVLCTSCPDKHTAPEEYFLEQLQLIKDSGIPFYDVNSDLRTPQVDEQNNVYCGGSIAKLYREQFNGNVTSFGKPTGDFYVQALKMLGSDKEKVLLVDDSFQSVEGIQQLGDVHQIKIDTLLVRGKQLGTPEKPRLDALEGLEWHNHPEGDVPPTPASPSHVAPGFNYGPGKEFAFVSRRNP